MAQKIRASIIGASGYTGGDLMRILLMHEVVELHNVHFFSALVGCRSIE